MNRLGWALLAAFVLAVIAVASMVTFSSRDVPSDARSHSLAAGARVLRGAAGAGLVIPVVGIQPASLRDNWGEPRGEGARAHHAIDIMAPRGAAVVAAAGGRVEKLFESAPGGHTLYIRSADGRTVYYYAHLDSYAPGLAEGMAVTQGQRIATVGATGDADPAAPHLHFEIKRMGAGDRWWQGTDVNPYPLLAERSGRARLGPPLEETGKR